MEENDEEGRFYFGCCVNSPAVRSDGASAQQLGTAAEAKAMLEKAAAELKKDEKAALDKFKKG